MEYRIRQRIEGSCIADLRLINEQVLIEEHSHFANSMFVIRNLDTFDINILTLMNPVIHE